MSMTSYRRAITAVTQTDLDGMSGYLAYLLVTVARMLKVRTASQQCNIS